MPIATSDTRDKYPLSRKKIWKKTLLGSIGWIIILQIFNPLFIAIPIVLSRSKGGLLVAGGYTAGFIILNIIIILLNFWYQRWYFNVYYYELGEDFLVIKKGPIAPKEINVPFDRIQDVYVDQDIFDRLFGLYDVHVSSATFMSGKQAHIDGLEKEAADGLKGELLTKVKERVVGTV
jgi:putative membrane protein